jgi:hypothetical protein
MMQREYARQEDRHKKYERDRGERWSCRMIFLMGITIVFHINFLLFCKFLILWYNDKRLSACLFSVE